MTKIAICTPTYGRPDVASVSLAYHQAASRLFRHPDFVMIDHRYFTGCDLVRARSRAARMTLETDCTHLLFWDDDVEPKDIGVLRGMVELDKDVVAIPYPRKRLDWDKVAAGVRDEAEQEKEGRQDGGELEFLGLDWPHRLNGEKDGVLLGASHVGMGFTLIKRGTLESLATQFGDAYGLTFYDCLDGKRIPTVAMFQLLIRDGMLLSEDYSFCQRVTDIGGAIWVLPVPAKHIGAYAYGAML